MNKKKIIVVAAAAALTYGAGARSAQGLKIYINPGHGGHDPDDRNVVIAPYAQGDPNGYWESNSNLDKGLQLRDMLQAKGYEVQMSRVTNTTDDDLALSTIVRLSNESGADLFISIHSNATGTSNRVNYPLMLFRGYDDKPVKPEDKVFATILNDHLLENQTTVWTHPNPNIRGDWSFYTSWGTQGLGVLRGNNVTGMLSEGSYHDYIPEAYRLMSKEFCWLEAYHFRKAIDQYFGVDGETTGVVTGRLNDLRFPRDGSFLKFGDDKLAPVTGATVRLLDEAGNVVDSYVTDPVNVSGFYLFKNVAPGTYKVDVLETENYYAITSDALTVTADNVTYANQKMQKKRLTPPVVTEYTPVWKEGDEGTLCNVPITLTFNWDMDTQATQAAFSIDPPIEGTFSWENTNTKLIFKPSVPYRTGTKYTVTLSTAAKHPGELNLEQPFTFSFTTNDRDFMSVLGHYPGDNSEVHYDGAIVEFRFDKKPNNATLQKQLSLTDMDGNKLAFYIRKAQYSTSKDAYGFFRLPIATKLTPGSKYKMTLSGEYSDKDDITIGKDIDVVFTAVDAKTEKEGTKVVDTMSDANFAYDAEGSTAVVSAAAKASTTQKLFTKSQQLTYQFDADATDPCEARYGRTMVDNDQIINAKDTLGVHIYGDLTGNEVYLELTSDVSTRYVRVATLDFLGWQYCEVPASEVEAPSRLSGIKIVEVPSQMSKKGTVYVDQISLAKANEAGLEDIVADENAAISVHPNPASNYLIANAGCNILSVELFSTAGAKVAEASGNVLNVSAVPAGNYLLRVNTMGAQSVHHVIVKH